MVSSGQLSQGVESREEVHSQGTGQTRPGTAHTGAAGAWGRAAQRAGQSGSSAKETPRQDYPREDFITRNKSEEKGVSWSHHNACWMPWEGGVVIPSAST